MLGKVGPLGDESWARITGNSSSVRARATEAALRIEDEDIFKKRVSSRPFNEPESKKPGDGSQLERKARRKEVERGRGSHAASTGLLARAFALPMADDLGSAEDWSVRVRVLSHITPRLGGYGNRCLYAWSGEQYSEHHCPDIGSLGYHSEVR